MKKEKIIQSIINDAKKLFVATKKLPWFLGIHAFWVILFLVLADLLFGGYIFYKYAYLSATQNPQATSNQIIFNESNYQQVQDIWQKREEDFNKLPEGNIINPFN